MPVFLSTGDKDRVFIIIPVENSSFFDFLQNLATICRM